MNERNRIIAATAAALWQTSRPLTAVGVLMLAAAALFAVGIAADARLITGAPAWLKPFKFAISTAIYSLTLAWIFTWLTGWPRVRCIVGWTTAVVFVVEVVIIAVQAGRSTTSHFTRPTDIQLAEVRAGGRMTISGGHTVGGPDGGPGLPVTGWSREHGDVRVPHFVGLHALQVLPILAFALGRWRRAAVRRGQGMILLSVSYAALFGLLLLNALRGNSVIAPDPAIAASLGAWLIASSAALVWIGSRPAHAVGRPIGRSTI